MSAIDYSSLEFHHVTDLANKLGAPIMVFDLEATTFRGRPNFGITEVACFMATLKGPGVWFESLINPERPIDYRAAELTGLTDAMVRNEQTWGVRFASLFKQLAQEVWVTGYNCNTFDLPAVIEVNARYGVPFEKFERSFDVRELHLKLSGSKSRKGKLAEVAALYGVFPKGDLHRASADTVLTLETLNAIIDLYGLDAVANLILPKPDGAVDKMTTQAVVRYVKSRKQATLAQMAADFAKDLRATSFELGKAIDERLVDAEVFASAPAQDWLQSALVELELDVLEDGRLRSMYEALQSTCPEPEMLDYVQLRVALLRAGFAWKSLKPA
jgi:DNA polymerase III epsilon subunit-like protein